MLSNYRSSLLVAGLLIASTVSAFNLYTNHAESLSETVHSIRSFTPLIHKDDMKTPIALSDIKPVFGAIKSTNQIPVEDLHQKDEVIEETTLPLNLIGVFVDDTKEGSAALIRYNSEDHYLHIGDTVADEAELISVAHNKVVILRRGAKEKLYFEHARSKDIAINQSSDTERLASTFNTTKDMNKLGASQAPGSSHLSETSSFESASKGDQALRQRMFAMMEALEWQD